MAKRILILGGSGFVGSYVAEYLKAFHEVKTTSTTGQNADFKFDISKGNLPDIKNFDCIINCVVSYDKEAAILIDINVKNTLNLLQTIAGYNCQYINISSVSATEQNFNKNLYSLSKHLADKVVSYYQFHSSLKLTTLRFPQIYDSLGKAKKMQPGLYFFAEKIKHGEPITLMGNKDKKRSYIPVEVLSKAILLAIDKNITGTHDVMMNDTYSPWELALTFANMNNYDTAKITLDKDKVVADYEIPECSSAFAPLLETENNLPWFKKLFDNA